MTSWALLRLKLSALRLLRTMAVASLTGRSKSEAAIGLAFGLVFGLSFTGVLMAIAVAGEREASFLDPPKCAKVSMPRAKNLSWSLGKAATSSSSLAFRSASVKGSVYKNTLLIMRRFN